jgi:hypothetical protein
MSYSYGVFDPGGVTMTMIPRWDTAKRAVLTARNAGSDLLMLLDHLCVMASTDPAASGKSSSTAYDRADDKWKKVVSC